MYNTCIFSVLYMYYTEKIQKRYILQVKLWNLPKIGQNKLPSSENNGSMI